MRRFGAFAVILLLGFAPLLGSRLLLNHFSLDQSSTLEQMLAPQEREDLSEYRRLFGIDADAVLLSLHDPLGVTAARRDTWIRALEGVPGARSVIAAPFQSKFSSEPADIVAADITAGNRELLLIFFESESRTLEQSQALVAQMSEFTKQIANGSEVVHTLGMPHYRVATWQVAREDGVLMLPLLVGLTALVSCLFFRSWVAFALSLILTSLTTFSCLLLQYVIQPELKMLVVFVVPVIWAIATLDAFHLYSRTAREMRRGFVRPAESAAAALFGPCALTTLTTAGCFATLMLLETSPLVFAFGLWATAGTLIAFALTFSLGVFFLARVVGAQSLPAAPILPSLMAWQLVSWAQAHRRAVILTWVCLAILACASVSQVRVQTPFPPEFSRDHPLSNALSNMRVLTGSDLSPIDLVLSATNAEGAEPGALLSAGLFTTNYLRTLEETRLVAPRDFLAREDVQAFAAGRHAANQGHERVRHESLPAAARHWINEDEVSMRLQWYLSPTTYKRREELLGWLENFDQDALVHHELSLAGPGYFNHVTEKRGLRSLFSSALLSTTLIVICLFAVSGSALQTLAGLLVSLLPALLVAGVMALLHIPWTLALLPMPVLLLGLVNDDTMHMLWRGRLAGERVSNRGYLSRRNALNAGPALIATTLVLASAIATLSMSGLKTNQSLGILVPTGLILALLCNLTLLPALSFSRSPSSG